MDNRDLSGGVEYLHSYDGARPFADFNTCGQAAVATILDHYGLDPYGLPRPIYDENDGRYHWRDDQIVDRIKERFPPDNFLGLFGTTGNQIRGALAWAGLETRLAYAVDLDGGRRIWEDVKRWTSGGCPVVVIVDRGKLGGRPFVAHWAVVHRVAGSRVYLANSKGTPVVSEDRFLRAFRCRFMPARFNHCAVVGVPKAAPRRLPGLSTANDGTMAGVAMESTRIRDYHAGDAPQVARLFYETVRSVNRADYSEEQVRAWAPSEPDPQEWHARMAGRRTLVAEEGGEVVGFAELERDGHLDMLYLRKDAVGRGVGRRLYRAVEREARCQGHARIFTEASITARPFFERHGFRVLREQTVSRRGVPMTNFAMEKSLRPSDGEGEQGSL